MNSAQQTFAFIEQPRRAVQGTVAPLVRPSAADRRGYYVSPILGMEPYAPGVCKARILDHVTPGKWHGFCDIVGTVKMPTQAVSHMLDLMVTWRLLERTELYYRHDGGSRWEHPGHANKSRDYHGYEWGYRRTNAHPHGRAPARTVQGDVGRGGAA